MRCQLTNLGAALLNANTGPIQVSTFKLGSAYGYVPAPTDTDIHGSLVYTGAPSQYFVVNANVVKYSVVLDYSLGPFSFGEVGIYTSTGVLFALATGDELLNKMPVTAIAGNSIRIDIYLSMVNQNYEMWLDYADTNNDFRMAVLQSVDQLPPVSQASPNAYILSGAGAGQSSFMAYTDKTGLWNFDAYAYQQPATIVACDYQSVTINNADFVEGIVSSYYGEVIAEFSTGINYSICRYVSAVVKGASTTVISFDNALMQLPIVGDTVIFFARQGLSTTMADLPIATSTTLGGIKVGNTLTVTTDGTLDVNPAELPVISVNGLTGDVELTGADIPGLSRVALTGQYTDILGAPGAYILPVATTTTIGGVKVPSNGHLTVASDGTLDIGFTPVLSVNGTTPDGNGNVAVFIPSVGLMTPVQATAGSNLNTTPAFTTTGIYFCSDANAASIVNSPLTTEGWVMDVESFSTAGNTGNCLQRLMASGSMYIRRYNATGNTWTSWVKILTTNTLPVATTSNLGMITVGAGLSVTPAGAVSTVIQTINGVSQSNIVISPSTIGAATLSGNRVPFYQSPSGDWFTAGTWDASANHIVQAYTGKTALDAATSLSANGMATIDMSYNGNNPNATGYYAVYQEGAVYEVIATGTTNLDGINTWNVGDFAVAANGKWARIALAKVTPSPLLINGANTTKTSGTVAPGSTDTMTINATCSAAVDIICFLSVNIMSPSAGQIYDARIQMVNNTTGQTVFNESVYVGAINIWTAANGVNGNSVTLTGSVSVASGNSAVAIDAYCGYFMFATGAS
jgi:hypothetical protein